MTHFRDIADKLAKQKANKATIEDINGSSVKIIDSSQEVEATSTKKSKKKKKTAKVAE